jgi:hypothetical protein
MYLLVAGDGEKLTAQSTTGEKRSTTCTHLYNCGAKLMQGNLFETFGDRLLRRRRSNFGWLVYSSWISLANKSLRAYTGDGLGYYDALLGDGRELPEVDDWSGTRNPPRQAAGIYSSLFLSFFLSVGRGVKRPESGQFLLFCSFFCFR